MRAIALLSAFCLAVACASTNLVPIGSTSADFRPEDDERSLWLAAREAENTIVPPGAVYEDGPLQQYVDQITDRLTPASYVAARGERVRVRVRKDPRLNASALSHGTLIVHTGLVARAENEAQLAGVLAHEIAHVTHRHHVREARAIQNRRTATNVVGFLAILAATAAAVDQANRGNYATADAIARSAPPLLTLGLNLSFAAMVSGYARDLEREADQEGMRLMAGAGYDPRQMAAMFRTMRDESGDRGALETFFWGNHPSLSERIETVERLSSSQYPVGSQAPIAPGTEFDRRVLRVRVSNAQYDAYMGRMVIARTQILKVEGAVPPAARPAVGALLQGMTWGSAARGARSRPNNVDVATVLMQRSVSSLERATSLAPPGSALAADAYRFKGLFLYDWWDSGTERCVSKPALERYLELRPDASDRDAIRTKIADLRWC